MFQWPDTMQMEPGSGIKPMAEQVMMRLIGSSIQQMAVFLFQEKPIARMATLSLITALLIYGYSNSTPMVTLCGKKHSAGLVMILWGILRPVQMVAMC